MIPADDVYCFCQPFQRGAFTYPLMVESCRENALQPEGRIWLTILSVYVCVDFGCHCRGVQFFSSTVFYHFFGQLLKRLRDLVNDLVSVCVDSLIACLCSGAQFILFCILYPPFLSLFFSCHY